MKKITFAIFAFMIASATFISCDNEPIDSAIDLSNPENPDNPEVPGGGGTAGPGVFKVDFDGQTYTATTTQAIVNEDYIAITGLKASTGEIIQLTVPSNQVGTYTWDTTNTDITGLALAYVSASGGQAYVSGPDDEGEFEGLNYIDTAILTVTEINTVSKTVSGNFQFTGARFTEVGVLETKVFTNGVFTNISYEADTPAPTNNFFTAKLDGSNYVATNIFGTQLSGKIGIVGRRGNVENISLSVPQDATPGTYEVDMFGDYIASYIANSTSSGSFAPDSGSITITSHDTQTNRIKGTFFFDAFSFFVPETHQITEGTFDVTY